MSAPSLVMAARDNQDSYFYAHTLAIGADGKLRLFEPDRITLPGHPFTDDSPAAQGGSEFVRDNSPPISMENLTGQSSVE